MHFYAIVLASVCALQIFNIRGLTGKEDCIYIVLEI